MPHKRNPVTCEQICGLARVVRANAQAAFEDIALWHERDISHSSVERVILPDSTILADYLLRQDHPTGGQAAGLSRTHAAQSRYDPRAGLLRPAAAGPGGRRDAARAGLPRRAGPRYARLGGRRRFPRGHRGRSGDPRRASAGANRRSVFARPASYATWTRSSSGCSEAGSRIRAGSGFSTVGDFCDGESQMSRNRLLPSIRLAAD